MFYKTTNDKTLIFQETFQYLIIVLVKTLNVAALIAARTVHRAAHVMYRNHINTKTAKDK